MTGITIEPTSEMVAFFEQRTNEHIARVRNCLHLLIGKTGFDDELKRRAKMHDASKFGEVERVPYIWLTEFHRCRQINEPFTYPDGIEETVKNAINHHLTNNRHHVDFHSNPNDMSDVDLIEMVCDWTAMAQELEQDGGSARGWADKTIGHQINFNRDRTNYLYSIIDLLDSAIKHQHAR